MKPEVCFWNANSGLEQRNLFARTALRVGLHRNLSREEPRLTNTCCLRVTAQLSPLYQTYAGKSREERYPK